MNKNFFSIILFSCFVVFLFSCPLLTTAQSSDTTVDDAIKKIETTFPAEITKITQEESAQSLIGKIIKIILGLVGIIALGIFLYGGIIWMTAGGTPKRSSDAKDILIWATLGLAVIFASYIGVDYILRALAK